MNNRQIFLKLLCFLVTLLLSTLTFFMVHTLVSEKRVVYKAELTIHGDFDSADIPAKDLKRYQGLSYVRALEKKFSCDIKRKKPRAFCLQEIAASANTPGVLKISLDVKNPRKADSSIEKIRSRTERAVKKKVSALGNEFTAQVSATRSGEEVTDPGKNFSAVSAMTVFFLCLLFFFGRDLKDRWNS